RRLALRSRILADRDGRWRRRTSRRSGAWSDDPSRRTTKDEPLPYGESASKQLLSFFPFEVAGNFEHLTRDVAAAVGAQIQNRVGQLCRFDAAVHGYVTQQFALHRLETKTALLCIARYDAIHALIVDRSGQDGIAAHLMRPQFACRGVGERFQCRLACHVGGSGGQSGFRGGRGEVDDGAGATMLHARYGQAHGLEHAVYVYLEHFAPFGSVLILNRRARARYPDTIDEEVHLPKPGDSLPEQGFEDRKSTRLNSSHVKI